MEENNEQEKLREATDNTITFRLDDAYFEDSVQYAQYTEAEAEEIILPTEADSVAEAETDKVADNLPVPSHTGKRRKKKKPFIVRIFSALINLVFLTGDNTIAFILWLLRKPLPLLFRPLKLWLKLVRSQIKETVHDVRNRPTSVPGSIKKIADKKLQAKKKKEDGKKHRPPYIRAFFSYIFSEKRLIKTVVNIAFPVIIILAVYNLFTLNNNQVFALEVYYNGQSLGYVESKEVFEEARQNAMLLVADTQSEALTSEPVYKTAYIQLNELSNPRMISENLIISSDTNYVRACGIYIDGEFLCAVRNESDAITVFESILEPYKKEVEESATVAFVEEIEYVTGLYPDDSDMIYDSSALRTLLSSPKSEAVYHTFKEGDTVKSVRQKYGLSLSALKALNPDVDFDTLDNLFSPTPEVTPETDEGTQTEEGTGTEEGTQTENGATEETTPEAAPEKPKEIKLLVSRQVDLVRVKVMRTRVTTVEIPFETEERNTSSLAKGTKKTSQEGSNGKKEVTELVTYINGEISYTTVISEKTVKKPVNKIILIGTKTYTSSSSGWTWPTRGANKISSPYGYRSASISGWAFHGGIDIVVGGKSSSGIPVVAAASGTVEKVQKSYSGYGYMVLINHGNGIKSRYAHMLAGSITVYTGQKVSKGQQIGKIGSTGNSTGPHLHFEVIVNGSKVDPQKYVKR